MVEHWTSLPSIPQSTVTDRRSGGAAPAVKLRLTRVIPRAERSQHMPRAAGHLQCPSATCSEPLWYGARRNEAGENLSAASGNFSAVNDHGDNPDRAEWRHFNGGDFGLSAARLRVVGRLRRDTNRDRAAPLQPPALPNSTRSSTERLRPTVSVVSTASYQPPDDDRATSTWLRTADDVADSRATRPRRGRQTGIGVSTKRFPQFPPGTTANVAKASRAGDVISDRRSVSLPVLSSRSSVTASVNVTTATSSGDVSVHQRQTEDRHEGDQDAVHPYADPFVNASTTFQQRLTHMTSLEAETKRWERSVAIAAAAARVKRKPPTTTTTTAATTAAKDKDS